jgi:hypothetical protein
MRSTISSRVSSGTGVRFMIRSWRTRSTGSEAMWGGEPVRVDLAALDGALDDGGHDAASYGDRPFLDF